MPGRKSFWKFSSTATGLVVLIWKVCQVEKVMLYYRQVGVQLCQLPREVLHSLDKQQNVSVPAGEVSSDRYALNITAEYLQGMDD